MEEKGVGAMIKVINHMQKLFMMTTMVMLLSSWAPVWGDMHPILADDQIVAQQTDTLIGDLGLQDTDFAADGLSLRTGVYEPGGHVVDDGKTPRDISDASPDKIAEATLLKAFMSESLVADHHPLLGARRPDGTIITYQNVTVDDLKLLTQVSLADTVQPVMTTIAGAKKAPYDTMAFPTTLGEDKLNGNGVTEAVTRLGIHGITPFIDLVQRATTVETIDLSGMMARVPQAEQQADALMQRLDFSSATHPNLKVLRLANDANANMMSTPSIWRQLFRAGQAKDLAEIDISGNGLTIIQDGVAADMVALPNLKTVNVGYNPSLTELPVTLLQTNLALDTRYTGITMQKHSSDESSSEMISNKQKTSSIANQTTISPRSTTAVTRTMPVISSPGSDSVMASNNQVVATPINTLTGLQVTIGSDKLMPGTGDFGVALQDGRSDRTPITVNAQVTKPFTYADGRVLHDEKLLLDNSVSNSTTFSEFAARQNTTMLTNGMAQQDHLVLGMDQVPTPVANGTLTEQRAALAYRHVYLYDPNSTEMQTGSATADVAWTVSSGVVNN